jgi:hypothetical protein
MGAGLIAGSVKVTDDELPKAISGVSQCLFLLNFIWQKRKAPDANRLSTPIKTACLGEMGP